MYVCMYVCKGELSRMDVNLTQLLDWSISNHMNVNVKKTKEMIISSSNSTVFNPLSVADVVIECVDVFKLLDVYINRSLKWDDHVRTICNKAASRIYFLKQLKRSSVKPEDLFYFFLRFGHSRQFCSSQHVRLQCHPPVQVVDACI